MGPRESNRNRYIRTLLYPEYIKKMFICMCECIYKFNNLFIKQNCYVIYYVYIVYHTTHAYDTLLLVTH